MKLSGILAEKGLHAFDGEPQLHTGLKVPRVWIVSADREEARIYRKTHDHVQLIAQAHAGHGKSHPDQADAGGGVPHGYDAHSSKSRHGDAGFIHHLVTWLEQAEREHVFDRLIIAAGPRTLGDLRALLNKPLLSRLAAEINKELVKSSDEEVASHVKDAAWG